MKWAEKTRTIYDKAIEVAELCYQKQGNKKYLEQAFMFAERNKAVVLYRVLQKNDVSKYQNQPTNSSSEVSESELATIQSYLSPKELLVEYFIGAENIYIFSITKDKLELTTRPKTKALLQQLKRTTTFSKADNGLALNYATYLEDAHELYKKLLPSISKTPPKRLVILPDEQLYNLAFATLLTQKQAHNPNASKSLNYDLPYLVRKCQLTYGYSVALLLKNITNQRSKKATKTLVSYAPAFNSKFGLTTLEQTGETVQTIAEKNQGMAHIGNVPLSLFKQTYPNYAIIHIATHAAMDTINSDLGRIYFTDSVLTTQQIYNLPFNNELILLGACESGSGLTVKGEGVMSLARAFMYSGNPSVVASLWQADEEATSQLFLHFFNHLQAGKEKDEALQLAQLAYLETQFNSMVGNAHPHYWAAFTHTGNWRPLPQKRNYTIWLVLGGIGLIGFLFWRFRF